MTDQNAQSAARPEPTPAPQPEPWMRGVAEGLHPVTGHLLRASEQIREDVAAALGHLSPAEIWAKPLGMTSAGFHARHLAGATDRLGTYLEGNQLTAEQIAAMKAEGIPSETPESAADLIALVNAAMDRYDALVRAIDPARFGEIREIGRKKLQTTVIGIATHIAEHGQRHVGGMIAAAKLARASA